MTELPPLADVMPFAARIGVELVSGAPHESRGRLNWAPHLCTTGGVLHGGALMTLADSVAAVCAFLNLPSGAGTATLESKTNFFRAVREGYVEAVARPLHAGRSTIVIQTDLRDQGGHRIAQVTQTQSVISS